MTHQEFKQCLDLIGWSQRGLAERIGMSKSHVRRWAEGEYPVPVDVARWLARLADAHRRNPTPVMVWIKRDTTSEAA